MLEAFQRRAKGSQLCVRQPHVAALVYAGGLKPGSYIGFFKDITQPDKFNLRDFLAANVLPGPGSRVRCLLQEQGTFGATKACAYEKDSALSHIPGFSYRWATVSNLPRPKQWTNRAIKDGWLASI